MKPSEIERGKTYTDGKREREVVNVGTYESHEPDIAYFLVGEADEVGEHYCLLSTFCRWAKAEVKMG